MLNICREKNEIFINCDELDFHWFIAKLNEKGEYQIKHYYGVIPFHFEKVTISDVLFDNDVIKVLKKCVKEHIRVTGEYVKIIDEIKKLLKDLEVD